MIGLYGGTFNPIHMGHMRAAEEVAEALGLERMLFVPSARPPHKAEDDADVIAPPTLRLEWVELAVRNNERFQADPIEVDRPGPSFLVDTLQALRKREGGDIVFVVGQDAFSEMGEWRDPHRLFRLAHICVTTRPPVTRGHLGEWLPECVRGEIEVADDGATAHHRDADTWIRQLAITELDISASDIRQRLRRGRSIRYLVPDAVGAAIEASQCYIPTTGPESGDIPA